MQCTICLKARRWSSDKSELHEAETRFRANRRLGRRFDDAGREHRRRGECQLSIGVGPMCSRTSVNYVYTCVEKGCWLFCSIRRVTRTKLTSARREYETNSTRLKSKVVSTLYRGVSGLKINHDGITISPSLGGNFS